MYAEFVQTVDPSDSVSIGAFLQSARERLGLRRSVIAAALDMGEQNIRYYEMGRNRLVAEDIPRFADAYRLTRDERERLATMLGLLPQSEADQLSDDDEADLQRLLRDKSLRVQFAAFLKSYDEANPRQKRFLLKGLRWFAEDALEDDAEPAQ